MNNKVKLSIGIPAYNEEANIGSLISALLKQDISFADLIEIVIISDASTDRTAKICKSFLDKRIKFFENETRTGKSLSQNKILDAAKGDILLMMDADSMPKSPKFIDRIIFPFFNAKQEKIGMTSARLVPLPALGFFDSVMNFSIYFKQYIYGRLNDKNNIYFANGIARAFSRDFYKSMHWQGLAGEDAFSYFECVKKGFLFIYVPSAEIYLKTPTILDDYLKQSVRFAKGNRRLETIFGAKLISESFKISTIIYIEASIKYFFKNPILFLAYLFLFSVSKFKSMYSGEAASTWEIAESTKILNLPK